ncbi:HAD family hydrolase [Phosphitispora fastidiosa]|uniref:HAD family hydrolase n=1 Tax=Phosphitispora fastidiosa TaxID=2837202 RepID=UPI001E593191|nr:HAD family hydrolase [Phosphitispora fastidiosa]MBU7006383.1 putative hydrolase of the HAD superfamily [Phosphitispora fastidiosa]
MPLENTNKLPKTVNPKAVVFDLDDTLYDERQFVSSGFKAVAQYLAGSYGLNNQKLFLQMQQLLCEEGRGRIFDRVLLDNGLDSSLVSLLVEVYRSHKPVLEFYPDAGEILRDLKISIPYLKGSNWESAPEIARDLKFEIKLGLITDGAAGVQWNKIKALGLEDMMDIIIVSDDFGTECWKPSPVPYQRVMDKLGVVPESCVYIGDNPEKDFVTARKLGWHTVRIWRPGGMCFAIKKDLLYEADFEITDLQQLKPILLNLWTLKEDG